MWACVCVCVRPLPSSPTPPRPPPDPFSHPLQVDVFDRIGAETGEEAAYVRPALRGTRFAEMAVAAR